MTGPMQRVVIMGAPGSGKSTLATTLAERTRLPLVRRDALGTPGSEPYRAALVAMAADPAWVLDGPPYWCDAVVFPRADTVVALDFPKPLVLGRVLRRSVRELVTRSPTVPGAWWGTDHPLRIAWTRHAERHAEIERLAGRPELAQAEIVRFTSPAELAAWVSTL